MISPPNPGNFQGQMTAAVVGLRNAFQVIENLNDYITAAGGLSFMETIISLSPEDAAVAVSTFANLAALNGAYNGGSAPVLNYKENSNLLWGGQ